MGNLTFIKYGGDPWRYGELPVPYLQHAFTATSALLGTSTAVMPAQHCACDGQPENHKYCPIPPLSGGALALLVLGGTVVACLLGYCLYRVRRRQRGSKGEAAPLKAPLASNAVTQTDSGRFV